VISYIKETWLLFQPSLGMGNWSPPNYFFYFLLFLPQLFGKSRSYDANVKNNKKNEKKKLDEMYDGMNE